MARTLIARYKKDPLKNNVFGFGPNIIKLKFTTKFDRCVEPLGPLEQIR